MADITPSQTIYVSNVYEKLGKEGEGDLHGIRRLSRFDLSMIQTASCASYRSGDLFAS